MHGCTDQEKKKLKTLKRKLKKLQTTQLPYRSGPITSNLENILQRNKICPQAYHGRSFIGNHCRKYLSTTLIESLTHSILIITNSLTKNYTFVEKAAVIAAKFSHLNKAYSDVHEAVGHDRPVSPEDIQIAETKIPVSYTHLTLPTRRTV